MKILIVDDEAMQRDLLKGFLVKKGHDVLTAGNGREAIRMFEENPVQLVLLDYRMPDMTGEDVLAHIKKLNPFIQAIMITAYGTTDTAVSVMKQGAADFLEKPVDLSGLLEKIEDLERTIMEAQDADAVAETLDHENLPLNIIGSGPGMKGVLSLAGRVAPTPWTVLIRGETGTGKELIARLIHLLGPSADGPFVEINCGAVPENLFESELFGHEKGAFTGAANARKGRFELAHGGTLFLDEIGELPVSLQPKLLRALQEKQITRVGGEKKQSVDVRVVAATNRDLKHLAESGGFREDLYYRLNVFEIELPPLRERKEDLPDLIAFFISRYQSRPIRFSADAMSTLVKYAFPGNVRELEHVIQRTVTLARGQVIQEQDLPPEIRFYRATEQGTLAERLEAVEREMLVTALEQHGWVQTRAADALGISERVLRYKIKKFEIRGNR